MPGWQDDVVEIEIYRGNTMLLGTGFLVGGNDVVTAAHVARELAGADFAVAHLGPQPGGGFAAEIPIAGGNWLALEGPYTADDVAVDVGLLTLAAPVAPADGFFVLADATALGLPAEARTAGFPAALGGTLQEVALGAVTYADAPAWPGGGKELAFYDAAALMPGSSGSPLFVEDPTTGQEIAFGLHAAGEDGTNLRLGPTFDAALLELLGGWAAANDDWIVGA